MPASQEMTHRLRLRCEVAVPSGMRQGRVFVRLRQTDPEVLELHPAANFGNATHQLINVWGRPLLTHLTEKDPVISGEMFRQGYWEFAESMTLLALARPGMTFVDAGANLGYYSVLLASTLQHEGRICAFEPESENTLLLTANALLQRQLYPQAASIEVFPCALTDRAGTARLNVFDRNLGMHSLVYGAKDAISTQVVSTSTLDELLEGGGESSTTQRVGLIKADVQGGELALLRGAERTLRRDQPVLCLEFEPEVSGAVTALELLEWLQEQGYRYFRVFHANVADPHQVLAEAVPAPTVEEISDRVRRKMIGSYGTLLASPGAAVGTKPVL